MKTISAIITILLLNVTYCLSGKHSMETSTQDTSKQKTAFEPSLFLDNLYIEGHVGTQILFSKDANNLKFSERFTPSFSLAAGKWFSPYWGARLQIMGFSLNGFSTVNGLYIADPQSGTIYGNNDPVRNYVTIRPDGSYRHFIRYINVNADFRVSLFNLIYGYDEQNRWDVIPSAGLGYMRVMDYKGVPKSNSISANFEVMGKYQLNRKIDINAKIQVSVLPDQFDGRIAGNIYESYSSVSIGVTYYFKSRGFKRVSHKIDPPVVKIVKETDTIYQVIKDTITVFVENVKPYTQAQSVITKIDLKFSYDSVQLKDNSQEEKIMELANILKENPDIKLRITGHTCNIASRPTNILVGMQRANTIKEKLVEQGVSVSQLITESKAFDEPLVPNTTEENMAQNRRVELRLE
jgi:outer membrane protein OmpA-like peptidoglycan-associated protein